MTQILLVFFVALASIGVVSVGAAVTRIATALEAQNRHYGVGAWNDNVASLLAAAKIVVHEFGGEILQYPEGKDLQVAIHRVESVVHDTAEAEPTA